MRLSAPRGPTPYFIAQAARGRELPLRGKDSSRTAPQSFSQVVLAFSSSTLWTPDFGFPSKHSSSLLLLSWGGCGAVWPQRGRVSPTPWPHKSSKKWMHTGHGKCSEVLAPAESRHPLSKVSFCDCPHPVFGNRSGVQLLLLSAGIAALPSPPQPRIHPPHAQGEPGSCASERRLGEDGWGDMGRGPQVLDPEDFSSALGPSSQS